MDLLVRVFIEKTCSVFKLKIALCNLDLKIARRDGNLNMVKKMHVKQNELADEFKKWKVRIKKRYEELSPTEQIVEELRKKVQHAEREAERICDTIEHREAQFKRNNSANLSETMLGDKTSGRRSPMFGKLDIKYPMKQEEYNARMSLPLEEHLKFARSLSRAEITSEIKTDITDRHDDEPLFALSWEDFTSYFLAENRKQHEADRLIENIIFKFVAYYWKAIESFISNGLVRSIELRSNRPALVEWTKERLGVLHKIVLKPFPLSSKVEGAMRDYIRLVNDAVIDVVVHVLQFALFDAFQTSKISEFCANPTLSIFKELVIDEITKSYGFFNNRQADVLPTSRTHLERIKNESALPANKWMRVKVRIQHEIGRLN